jgi:hypothetical protein
MRSVTLYPPEGNPLEYKNVTDVEINQGVLQFRHQENKQSTMGHQVGTSLPFLIQEEVSIFPGVPLSRA